MGISRVSKALRREELRISAARSRNRIAVAGVAVSSLALGLAVPAHADTAPQLPPAPAVVTVAAPAAPTTPDTSQAAAAAAQLAAANVNVSIRIGSPGDNGAVTQASSASADAVAQTAAQAADTQQSAAAQATATQTAPANVAVSIRIGSPGADGSLKQSIEAGATANASADPQYHAGDGQYQPAPSVSTTTPTTGAPPPSTDPSLTAQPTAQPALGAAPPAATVPAFWNWTWTWTCGDITGSGITKTIDTGIQGWIWTWNLDSICVTPPTSSLPISPVSPPESGGSISLPSMPTPPVAPVVTPPAAPAPVEAPAPAAEDGAVTTPGVVDAQVELTLDGVPLPPAAQLELPQREPSAPLPLPAGAAAALPFSVAQLVGPTVATHTSASSSTTVQPRQKAAQLAPSLSLDAPPLLPASGAGAASGGGGGGGSVAAALAIWFLLQLPGAAALRLPPRQRSPRTRVDDIHSRPG